MRPIDEVRHLPALLRGAAEARPDHPALELNGVQMTFAELEHRSSRWASVLQRYAARSGDRIAVWCEKSLESVAVLYGIMKAGCAYVPVDPAAPQARMAQIVRNCGARVLVLDARRAAEVADLVPELAPDVEALAVLDARDDLACALRAFDQRAVDAADSAHIDPDIDEHAPAYILHTSGTTGRPKGVTLTHGNALAFLRWAVPEFAVSSADRLANHAPFHFDLSTFDLFAAAAAAATCVLVPRHLLLLPGALLRFWSEARVSCIYVTPTTLSLLRARGVALDGHLRGLRLVLFAGEPMPAETLRTCMHAAPQARFANLYGPTETNVCTWYDVSRVPERGERIPIGRACPECELWIVDDEQRAVAPGEVGELWVSGAHVMAGYWADPEGTARALRRITPAPGRAVRAYRTGDLVCQRSDGVLEFVGRRDQQVKTRGHRVELGEVEWAIGQHAEVAQVAVCADPDPILCHRLRALVVLRDGANTTTRALFEHCAALLPAYMLPEAIEIRRRLPATSSGKIDRDGLRHSAS